MRKAQRRIQAAFTCGGFISLVARVFHRAGAITPTAPRPAVVLRATYRRRLFLEKPTPVHPRVDGLCAPYNSELVTASGRMDRIRCRLGTAALILPAALAACTNSIPLRQYERPPSHITGKDHRAGTSEPNNTFWLRW